MGLNIAKNKQTTSHRFYLTWLVHETKHKNGFKIFIRGRAK